MLGNNPTHKSNSTKEWLPKNEIIFEWSSHSPDLNPTENLWNDYEEASVCNIIYLEPLTQKDRVRLQAIQGEFYWSSFKENSTIYFSITFIHEITPDVGTSCGYMKIMLLFWGEKRKLDVLVLFGYIYSLELQLLFAADWVLRYAFGSTHVCSQWMKQYLHAPVMMIHYIWMTVMIMLI